LVTSILLAALMSPGASPESPATETPAWQTSYTEARELGRREKKPLAVFVGSGLKGFETLSQEGSLAAAAGRLLARDYVCVYVNSDTERGKRLAGAFSMTQGLVVSTRDGDSQAFRHSGRMSARDLEATLKRYANGRAVDQTETLQQRVSASYAPPAPAARPAYPSSFGGFGGFGGGGFGGGGSC
jgi:hypothetical protein